MCARVVQRSGPLPFASVTAVETLFPPQCLSRDDAVPGQELPVIRRHPETGEFSFDRLRWGLIPHWITEASPKVRPFNARAESIASNGMFREAYARRRCIVPMDAFFEWEWSNGRKRPHAFAMKDGKPFGVAGIWENRRHPESGEWQRSFAIVTTAANVLVARIHDRMPVILAAADHERWLGTEPDPHELLRPYPAPSMVMAPVSSRVVPPGEDRATAMLF